MIGSRAVGCARAESDIDLVIVIELPADAAPWGGKEFAQSGRQLQAALGHTAVRPDLRVRTTDRFAEAKDVPGGVEWLAVRNGVSLFEAPCERVPRVRTSPHNVRRELVSSWMHHAASAAEAFWHEDQRRSERAVADLVLSRLIPAVLVHHGVAPRYTPSVAEYHRQIPAGANHTIRAIDAAIRHPGPDLRSPVAQAIHAVIRYLSRDAVLARLLTGPVRRFRALGCVG